jgi:hypothetical protein
MKIASKIAGSQWICSGQADVVCVSFINKRIDAASCGLAAHGEVPAMKDQTSTVKVAGIVFALAGLGWIIGGLFSITHIVLYPLIGLLNLGIAFACFAFVGLKTLK